MATLRRGSAYRKVVRPYTRRSKFKRKGYIKVIPDPKITKFRMGELRKDFPRKVLLVSRDNFQIRHNALESCRMMINKHLTDKIGAKNYQYLINQYPHHILRENKMLTGAGADRMQSGMAHSFGRSVGSAAQIKPGTIIMTVYTDDNFIEQAKKILYMTRSRIPGRVSVEII